jgi:GNAT superfamily N-acetyltransferase
MLIIEIRLVNELLCFDLSDLLEESILEGHHHIQRLLDDYKTGVNRFALPGECLFLALQEERVIGVCGLNRDLQNGILYGRLRRFYVIKAFRRSGIGKRLVDAVIANATTSFKYICLHTDSPIAAAFYKSMGFEIENSLSNSTHVKVLKN